MRRTRKTAVAGAVLLAATAVTAVLAGTTAARTSAAKTVIIGAAVDLTAQMSPYDSPALAAAQFEAAKVNAAGGIKGLGGAKIQILVCNHQLKKQKECADQLIGKGAAVGLVTCDVEYAAPATQ